MHFLDIAKRCVTMAFLAFTVLTVLKAALLLLISGFSRIVLRGKAFPIRDEYRPKSHRLIKSQKKILESSVYKTNICKYLEAFKTPIQNPAIIFRDSNQTWNSHCINRRKAIFNSQSPHQPNPHTVRQIGDNNESGRPG